jgi:hypothetical protein
MRIVEGGIRRLVTGAYRLLVAWWAEPLEAWRCQAFLRSAITTDLAFLFCEEFKTQFLPYPKHPKHYWGKIVIISVSGLLLQIARDRGEYFADVSPQGSNAEWSPIMVALEAADSDQWPDPEAMWPHRGCLRELGRLLQPRFAQLVTAFSQEHYAATYARMKQISERNSARWERLLDQSAFPGFGTIDQRVRSFKA